MIDLPTNELLSDLDPIIVTAPVVRSGTTLIQRLLCSSARGLIYGELCAQDLEFFLNLYAIKTQEYHAKRRMLERNMQQVLTGNVDDWIPDLTPDVDEYLSALGHSAFAGVGFCRDYARRVERPVWGFKYPGWTPAFIRLLRTVMPRARFIVILRDLGACARSAKGIGAINSVSELQEFCRAWAEGTEYWRRILDDAATLVLDYEELTTAAVLVRLADFTGLSDIKLTAVARKINIWTGNVAPVESHDGYVAPAGLTEPEQRIVDEASAGFREQVLS